jgi:hypothetical protein
MGNLTQGLGDGAAAALGKSGDVGKLISYGTQGIFSGAAQGGLGAGLDPDTWQQGMGQGLLSVGEATGIGAAVGLGTAGILTGLKTGFRSALESRLTFRTPQLSTGGSRELMPQDLIPLSGRRPDAQD